MQNLASRKTGRGWKKEEGEEEEEKAKKGGREGERDGRGELLGCRSSLGYPFFTFKLLCLMGITRV